VHRDSTNLEPDLDVDVDVAHTVRRWGPLLRTGILRRFMPGGKDEVQDYVQVRIYREILNC